MKIPKNDGERDELYLDLYRKCQVSLETRKTAYARRRDYFLYGAGGGEPARFNKIRPQLETLCSFIYSAETTRFSIQAGASLNRAEKTLALQQIPSLNRGINDKWMDSNADQVFRLAVLWGSVYDSMFIKLVVRDNKIFPYLVEPSCFGVLREEQPFLDQQEAFIHEYYLTASELADHLIAHPHKDKIMRLLKPTAAPKPEGIYENVNRMLISQVSPQLSGVVGNPWDWNQQIPYIPEVEESVIAMADLYVWDSEAADYRIVTMAERAKLYDNTMDQVFLKCEHPFIQVCPDPVPDYFWGYSDVEKLAGLQDMYSTRVEQIVQLMDRQADPAYWGQGVSDEQAFAAKMAAGFINTDDNGKIVELTPEIPDDLFKELDRITEMFSDALGITNVLAGRGEAGVRSKGHASELARLGSARPKQRALIIEDALEKVAGLYLKLMQKYDKTHYSDTEDRDFVARQFTGDHSVKVDAHSNSPIFVEDNRALAFDLYKAKVITRERLIELLDPPMKQQLLEDVKVIEQKEAAAMQAKQQGG